MAFCHGCSGLITDQYILRVSPDLKWHEKCLKCTACDILLGDFAACFIHYSKPYCQKDYEKLFVARCHGCDKTLEKNILVMKENGNIFHVDCFVCGICGVRLLPGNKFSASIDGQLFCGSDYCSKDRNGWSDNSWSDAYNDENMTPGSDMEVEHCPLAQESSKTANIEHQNTDSKVKPTTSKRNSKDKPTRVRTVLNEKQLSILKRCYCANPRPDSVMKEQLVELTGLSARVIRVWFQNKRCKDKKKSMMMNANDRTARDMMQTQLSLHSSSPGSDDISLPGCSPPLSCAVSLSNQAMSAHGNSNVDPATQSLQLMVNDRSTYTANTASFPCYGVWSKYGDYQHNYQDESYPGHFHQLVS